MNEEKIQQITESTNLISKWSENFLEGVGLSGDWFELFHMLFLLIVTTAVVLIIYHITRVILKGVFDRVASLPRMSYVKHLKERKFPHYLSMIIPYSLVRGAIPIVFTSYPAIADLAIKGADIYLVFYVIWMVMSAVKAFGDSLKDKETLKDKPIDSYLQVVSIFLYFIAFIIVFSILTGKNPMYFVGGLGAASAILLLVFKDTIMGFVASIQVSANDMVRIGDWISMPKHGADGDVIQITLTTVKIQNFDRTISTIPPYALVSESFQNWRGMRDAGGRRLKRSVFIKQSSIRFIEDQELDNLKTIQLLSDYIDKKQKEIVSYNEKTGADKSLAVNGRNLTNMGLYRKYIDNYLRSHSGVHQDLTLMVRQLQPSAEGLPLELYFFTATTVWTEYEGIVADVFDHITAAAKFFDIELFEDISNPIGMRQ